jgi:hypothetical protein
MYSKNLLYDDFNRKGRVINFKYSYHYTLKDYFHIVKLIRFVPGKYNKILLIDSDVLLVFEHLDFDMNLLNKFHKLFGVSYYFENKKKDDLLCVKPCLDLSQINNNNIMYLTFNGIDNIKFPENLPNLKSLNITKSTISYLPYYPKIHSIYLSKTNILIIPDDYKNVYVMSDHIVIHNKTVKCDYWMSCSTLCNKRHNIMIRFQKIFKLRLARRKILIAYHPNYLCGYLGKKRLIAELAS